MVLLGTSFRTFFGMPVGAPICAIGNAIRDAFRGTVQEALDTSIRTSFEMPYYTQIVMPFGALFRTPFWLHSESYSGRHSGYHLDTSFGADSGRHLRRLLGQHSGRHLIAAKDAIKDAIKDTIF